MTDKQPRSRIDFARVAAAALQAAESLLREWLPHGHREGHEWKSLNPTRADSRVGSFSINLNTGAWGDFATSDAGGDLVSLYAYLNGVDQLPAARAIAERLGIPEGDDGRRSQGPTRTHGPSIAKSVPAGESDAARAKPLKSRSEWVPILPAPDDAGEWPKAHIKRGRPAGVWIYRDAAGKPLGAVYRFTTSDGGKEVLPCCYAEHRESAAREWRWLAFPEPRPLYGLDLLAAKPDAPVLVVEGEKCADAARAYLGDALAIVTWPGGCKAADKADWLPLRRRKVILWPDCDAQTGKDGELLPEAAQPGIRAMERIALALAKLDCQVRIVAIPAPGAKPSGWDIVDAIAEGWSAEQLRSFIKDHLRPPAFAAAANRERVEIDESTASDRRHNLEAELRADPELMAALGELADQPSEDGVASLFVNHVGLPRFRFVANWNRWHAWDGRRWVHDTTLSVFDAIRRIVVLKVRGSKSERATASAAFVAGVERLVRHDQRVVVVPEQLDADPWLLNTHSGVVDLRTGVITPHDPRQLMTMLAGSEVDPEHGGALWAGFLRDITQGNRDLEAYLQRLAGYCATGVTSEDLLAYLWGVGGNGKSSFLEALSAALGDYALTFSPEVLMESRGENTRPNSPNSVASEWRYRTSRARTRPGTIRG